MNMYDPIKPLIAKMDEIRPIMGYEDAANHNDWYKAAYDKIVALTGYGRFEKVDDGFRIEYEKEHETYDEIRFVIATERDCHMPCHLLLPKGMDRPALMICLQGHSTGMHISLGKAKFEADEASISGGRDIGIQAVNQGMAALCIEQRGFGERREHERAEKPECHIPAMAELLIGRTMTGARAWDVSRAIDAVESHFADIDTDRIYITGNSGGGTVTYYATCLDTRIKACMPSCAICPYSESIAVIRHCVCNHIPHILDFFEMGDLAGLIAPRPMVIVAGKEDDIFPIEGTLKAFEKIKAIYSALDCGENCRLVIGEGGHRFYPELAWPEFMELVGAAD